MTQGALAQKIVRRIRAEGPISVAAYMAMALHDPVLGYYARRRPIGAAGDFVTAPEISQVFGELVGVWCALVWERIGRPDPVVLAELGPGSGVLAADLLRAASAMPEFRRALRIHLVEISAGLRAEQRNRLATTDPVWLSRTEDLPEGPLILIANEFLDALPIRQLVRGARYWSERMVALGPDGRLAFADTPENPIVGLVVPEKLRHTASPGAVFEICPSALALSATLGARLRCSPGAALFVDYGYSQAATGPSLRGLRDHRPADVLEWPGSTDLSADVDFAAVADAARAVGAEPWGPVPQRHFLQALGVWPRLAALTSRARPAERLRLESGVARLLDPAQMGNLFKVMALASPGLPAPPGFD